MTVRLLTGALMLALTVGAPTILVAQQSTPAAPSEASGAEGGGAGFVEITPEMQKAIEKGLAYLAKRQMPDGSYGRDRYGHNTAITALAALAFMAHGDLPGRGKYGDNVRKAVEFILDSVHPSGLIVADASHGPMYGHGFATLMLSEIYGQSHDPRVREALVKAVRLIIHSQNEEGGWRYHPVPDDADISVTIVQVMALRGARNAGIKVPKQVIEDAISYVRRCQNPDGGFRYMLHSGGSAFPRSAAGVAALYYAGLYEGQAIEEGLEYLMRHMPGQGGPHHALLLRALLCGAGDVSRRR